MYSIPTLTVVAVTPGTFAGRWPVAIGWLPLGVDPAGPLAVTEAAELPGPVPTAPGDPASGTLLALGPDNPDAPLVAAAPLAPAPCTCAVLPQEAAASASRTAAALCFMAEALVRPRRRPTPRRRVRPSALRSSRC